MDERIPVEIYAFVGVIGSGKSYRLEQMKREYNGVGQVVITADFSDGIRDLTRQLLGYSANFGDVNSQEYRDWKENVACVTVHNGVVVNSFTGRDILRNVGESTKCIAGQDVWARYTTQSLYSRIAYQAFRSDLCVRGVRVLIGSVRFKCEARSIFELFSDVAANLDSFMNPSLHFILCDYHSSSYDATSSHVSEALAQAVLDTDKYKDGDDITELIDTMV